MADETIRLRDIVETEIDQLQRYGEAAEEFFHRLSEDIRAEFNQTLEQILTQEVGGFQQQMRQSFAAQGMDAVGTAMGDVLGRTLESNGMNGAYGQVFSEAIAGAVHSVLGELAQNGSVEWGDVVRGANRSGGRALDRVLKTGHNGWLNARQLNLSPAQRSAVLWESLSRARRGM